MTLHSSLLRYLRNLDRLEEEHPDMLADITGGIWAPQRDIDVRHAMFCCAAFYFSEEYPKWCEIVQKVHDMWEEEE
jgi:hypothetical protein